jgi:hypothetical protein
MRKSFAIASAKAREASNGFTRRGALQSAAALGIAFLFRDKLGGFSETPLITEQAPSVIIITSRVQALAFRPTNLIAASANRSGLEKIFENQPMIRRNQGVMRIVTPYGVGSRLQP